MVTNLHPTSLKEALRLLNHTGASPVAGGTDWMISRTPGADVFFLNSIPEMQAICQTDEGLSLGACLTYAHLLEDSRVPGALKDAVSDIASPAIRNLGTIGGNIVNASPAGDTLPVLYALNATVELQSADGHRTLPIERFITGVKRTAIQPGELLTRIFLPAFEGVSTYQKVGARRAQAISKCSFAGFMRVESGILRDLRIAFGAVGPTVVRSRALEASLCELPVSAAKEKIGETVAAYGKLISPIDDARSTAEYRRAVCLNMLEGFLKEKLV